MRHWLSISFCLLVLLTSTWCLTLCSEGYADNKSVPAKPLPAGEAKKALKELTVKYQACGLPMPPEGAPLVRVVSSGPSFYLGFLVERATESDLPVILVGTRHYKPMGGKEWVTTVQPKAQEVSSIKAGFREAAFRINAGLATAIQCYSRGWKELAVALLQKSLWESAGHRSSNYYQPAGLAPKTALTFMAWAHWGNELVEPKSDRAAIYQRMKALYDSEPKLRRQTRFRLVKNAEILESLKATLAPSKAKPGSVEALIDNLTEATGNWCGAVEGPAYKKLVLLGFGAVPALINHMDDKRLTRIIFHAFMNSPPRIRRVKDVIRGLLHQLSGNGIGRGDKPYASKEDALAWWKKAQVLGEEKHLLRYVFPLDKRIEWPNTVILQVLTHKYPRHLPRLYRKLLDEHPHMQSWPLADAIAESKLPRDQKVELFSYAGKHSNLEHRRAAFWELKDFDHERFVTMLIKTLKELPATPKEPYWICTEASFACLVMQTTDSRAWRALVQTARRVDVGLRKVILKRMNYKVPMKCETQQRLDLLAEFLDDESVQNLAAEVIACILDLDVNPQPNWTAEQWAQLRARVRKKLKRK